MVGRWSETRRRLSRVGKLACERKGTPTKAEFARGHWLPAVALHGAAIFKSAFVMRVFSMLQKILEIVHSKVQVKVIFIAYIHMQFVNKFSPKRGQVFSEVVAQVIPMFTGIVYGIAVYFACKVIP